MAFKKGQSGNPGGRPKKTEEIVEVEMLARRLSAEAMERLAYWMRQDDGNVSVKASNVIIERAFGKAKQSVETTITDKRMVAELPPTSKDANEWSTKHGPH